MNVIGDTNQASSAGEEAGLDPREAAKILEQTTRQARRQFDARSPLAAYTEALRHLLGGLAPWAL